jgi:hypothetical protein
MHPIRLPTYYYQQFLRPLGSEADGWPTNWTAGFQPAEL